MPAQSWTEVLDKVEQMLARSATAAELHEQSIAAAPAATPDEDRAASWRRFLDQLEQHLGGLQRCTEQATAAGAAADAELHAGQEAVSAWLQRRTALAQNLADGAAPSV
jgi:hypothetical protein